MGYSVLKLVSDSTCDRKVEDRLMIWKTRGSCFPPLSAIDVDDNVKLICGALKQHRKLWSPEIWVSALDFTWIFKTLCWWNCLMERSIQSKIFSPVKKIGTEEFRSVQPDSSRHTISWRKEEICVWCLLPQALNSLICILTVWLQICSIWGNVIGSLNGNGKKANY